MTTSTKSESWISYGSPDDPGVLLFHPWWGISEGTRSLATAVAAAGFHVVLPDLYQGKIATTEDEAEGLRKVFPSQDQQARTDAALAYLRPADDLRPFAVAGLSMGVGWALDLAASDSRVRAVVLYYGTGGVDDLSKSRFATLGHFAEDDPWEPNEYVQAQEEALRAAGEVRFLTYPGTSHWFAEHDVSSAYDPDAARLALERSVAFLKAHLSGSR